MKTDEKRPLFFRRLGSGWGAGGPGFYVWDEDRTVADHSARELAAVVSLGTAPRPGAAPGTPARSRPRPSRPAR